MLNRNYFIMWHVTISYGVLFRKLYMPALHRYWEEHTNSTEAKNGAITFQSCILSCELSVSTSATDNSCFQLEGVCDVVLYLGTVQTEVVSSLCILLKLIYSAREVWCVPSWFHHLLCCGKLLGQNTLEAFLDKQAFLLSNI
jgi:hypothetical protein